MTDKLATIGHLREALQELVNAHPCKTPDDKTCHCPTCLGDHALAASSGFAAPKETL